MIECAEEQQRFGWTKKYTAKVFFLAHICCAFNFDVFCCWSRIWCITSKFGSTLIPVSSVFSPCKKHSWEQWTHSVPSLKLKCESKWIDVFFYAVAQKLRVKRQHSHLIELSVPGKQQSTEDKKNHSRIMNLFGMNTLALGSTCARTAY